VNENEVIDLLSIAQAFDKRTVGEAEVTAWLDSAKRARWTFDEASEAVKDYYAKTTSERPWIMPSHVTNMIRAEREIRHMRAQTRELTQPLPPRVARAVETVAASTVIPSEPREPKQPALRVECPHCHAKPREGCTRPSVRGRDIPVKPHPSRVQAAKNRTDAP
jgi:hypothetical protein